MDRPQLEGWLEEYGNAWQAKNTHAFTGLFAADVRYYWTPFEEPKQGREGLAAAFDSAVARQSAIRFSSTVLSVADDRWIAHWHCSFDRVGTGRRVQLDGIFQMEFDASGKCNVFREWWHSNEFV